MRFLELASYICIIRVASFPGPTSGKRIELLYCHDVLKVHGACMLSLDFSQIWNSIYSLGCMQILNDAT